MIQSLLLIFDSVATWDKLAAARRRWTMVFVRHLMPLLLLVAAVEGYGLVRWGTSRGTIPHIEKLSLANAVVFEAAQLMLSLAVVFWGAKLIKSLSETFYGRHSFDQTFTVAAYGLAPLFLMRLFDMFPEVSPWATWGIGIALSVVVLYNGLPRVMEVDPPHALGLFMTSIVPLILLAGLVRFLTIWYLRGKFPEVDSLISIFTGQGPQS